MRSDAEPEEADEAPRRRFFVRVRWRETGEDVDLDEALAILEHEDALPEEFETYLHPAEQAEQ